MATDFDFTTLNSVATQAANRIANLPQQEVDFIASLESLSTKQQALRTSTLVAKTGADQKAAKHMADFQANQRRTLEAKSNPFHDMVAFFSDDVQSNDELLAEQQRINQDVQTLNNNYLQVRDSNVYKHNSLQERIDSLSKINAVRGTNAGLLARLNQTATSSVLNQSLLAVDHLNKTYTEKELGELMKNNTSDFSLALIEQAWMGKTTLRMKQEHLSNRKGSDASLTDEEWITRNSKSASGNRDLMFEMQAANKDTLMVAGREIAASAMTDWLAENDRGLSDLYGSAARINGKQLQVFGSNQGVLSVLGAAIPGNPQIAMGLVMPQEKLTGEKLESFMSGVGASIAAMPSAYQSNMIALVDANMQLTNFTGTDAASVWKRNFLQAKVLQAGAAVKEQFGKTIKARYAGDKEAQAGVDEYLASDGKSISNPRGAIAIIITNVLGATGPALDIAVSGSYLEGSLSPFANTYQGMLEDYQNRLNPPKRPDTRPDGTPWSFMEKLDHIQQDKLQAATNPPPDAHLIRQALKTHGEDIVDASYGRIANFHLAATLRALAVKYSASKELAQGIVDMQMGEGFGLSAELLDAKATNIVVMQRLAKLQVKAQAKGELSPEANLVTEFRGDLRNQAVITQIADSLRPANEVGIALDTILFKGNIVQMYRAHLKVNFGNNDKIREAIKVAEDIQSEETNIKIAGDAARGVAQTAMDMGKPVSGSAAMETFMNAIMPLVGK